MNMPKKMRTVLILLSCNFVLIVLYFLAQILGDLPSWLFTILIVLGLVFCVLGGYVAYRALSFPGTLKWFLVLTGLSAVMPLVGAVLHNIFYAFQIYFSEWQFLWGFLSVVFFIIALLVAPITFIVGLVGSFILLKKNNI